MIVSEPKRLHLMSEAFRKKQNKNNNMFLGWKLALLWGGARPYLIAVKFIIESHFPQIDGQSPKRRSPASDSRPMAEERKMC